MFQPVCDTLVQVVKCPRYTGFAVVLAMDVAEYFADLLLS